MKAEPAFVWELAGDATADLVLPAVEDVDVTREVLRAPYQPLHPAASKTLALGGSLLLLEPECGIVPFHGRDDKLQELNEWANGELGSGPE